MRLMICKNKLITKQRCMSECDSGKPHEYAAHCNHGKCSHYTYRGRMIFIRVWVDCAELKPLKDIGRHLKKVL